VVHLLYSRVQALARRICVNAQARSLTSEMHETTLAVSALGRIAAAAVRSADVSNGLSTAMRSRTGQVSLVTDTSRRAACRPSTARHRPAGANTHGGPGNCELCLRAGFLCPTVVTPAAGPSRRTIVPRRGLQVAVACKLSHRVQIDILAELLLDERPSQVTYASRCSGTYSSQTACAFVVIAFLPRVDTRSEPAFVA
jgi:hypothetical protein